MLVLLRPFQLFAQSSPPCLGELGRVLALDLLAKPLAEPPVTGILPLELRLIDLGLRWLGRAGVPVDASGLFSWRKRRTTSETPSNGVKVM
jgi:hypothetical protein